MRVTAVKSTVVNATAHANWIFVSIETDDGLTGLGEATLQGHESLVVDAVDDLGASLLGQDPLPGLRPGPRPHGGHVAAAALSGLEQAVWDLRGKAYGLPVHRLLGGGRAAVPVYANISAGTADRSATDVCARAEAAIGAGFRAIKCAPFDEYHWWDSDGRQDRLDAGVRRVEALRRSIPDGVALMVDCHWRFDVPTAVDVGRRLAPLNLRWYESPVAEHDPAWLREVRDRTGLRIAAGELYTGLAGFRQVLDAGGADVLVPDVKYVGGIEGLLKVGALADAFGARVAPHNPSGPVATAATLQAASALEALLMVEYRFGEVDWYGDLVQAELSLEDGSMAVATAPGLGVTLDWTLAAKHPYRHIVP